MENNILFSELDNIIGTDQEEGIFPQSTIPTSGLDLGNGSDSILNSSDTLDFTRATTATFTDFEGLIKDVNSGELRFDGLRRVENLFSWSNDLNNSIWSVADGASKVGRTIIDGYSVMEINFTAANLPTIKQNIVTTTGKDYTQRFWVRMKTGTGNIRIRMGGQLTSNINISEDWVLLSDLLSETVGASRAFGFRNGLDAVAKTIYIREECQLEDVTGQTNQNPSEHVSIDEIRRNNLNWSNWLDPAIYTDWVEGNTGTTVKATVINGLPSSIKHAWTITDSDASQYYQLSQDQSIVSGTKFHTASAYFKKTTGATTFPGFGVSVRNGNNQIGQLTIDTNTGVLTDRSVNAPYSSNIEDVGDAWRVSITEQDNASGNTIFKAQVFPTVESGVSPTGVWSVAVTGACTLAGFQIDINDTDTGASSYESVAGHYKYHGAFVDGVKYLAYENGNTVASNIVTENRGNAIAGGAYQCEEQSTNLTLYSEDFTTSWITDKSSISSNVVVAPDGTLTMDKLVEDSTNTQHRVSQADTYVAGQYVSSLFAKSTGDNRYLKLYGFGLGGVSQGVIFDLVNGVVDMPDVALTILEDAGMILQGDGSYRCWIRFTSIATSSNVYALASTLNQHGTETYLGDGTSGVYIWGAQVDAGAKLLSYVKTEASTVTRNADNLDLLDPPTEDLTVIMGLTPVADGINYESTEFRLFGTDDSRGTTYEMRTLMSGIYDYVSQAGGGYLLLKNTDITKDTRTKIAFSAKQQAGALETLISYTGDSASVASEETLPSGVSFKTDGTKMYVVGLGNDKVYQYTLSTAWDSSTATYDSVFISVSSQDLLPQDITFSSDGTKMYIVGSGTDRVYQYTLSTAWDLSTALYSSKNFSVSTQETVPAGVIFNADGTKMYIIGNTNDTIFQYTIGTAWDVSTASYDSVSFSVVSEDTQPASIVFNSNGTHLYMAGNTNNTIYEYKLSSAYDISTMNYTGYSLNITSQESTPTGITIGSNDTKIYIIGFVGDAVFEYDLVIGGNTTTDIIIAKDGTIKHTESNAQALDHSNLAFNIGYWQTDTLTAGINSIKVYNKGLSENQLKQLTK